MSFSTNDVSLSALVFAVVCFGMAADADALGRERAAEQIPALVGRILESQEEILATESELEPLIEGYDRRLEGTRDRIERASSEGEAAAGLVDYVEAYNARLEAQANGLESMRAPIVRMRADAAELVDATRAMGDGAPSSEQRTERKQVMQEHFEGLATGISELAPELGRQEEAGIAGSVLQAGWASVELPAVPHFEVGPDAALVFAKRTDGLWARYQARSRQLEAEQRSVRRLLDLLIERQLAQRLEDLFANDGSGAGLLAANGLGQGWGDLGDLVNRALGLPGADGSASVGTDTAMERLDYFASGRHRQ